MALTECKECKKLVSDRADKCPSCGAPPGDKPKWANTEKISLLSAIVAVFGVVFGLWQYSSSENWKRSEFVSAKIRFLC
jgi:hypothetical protein